LALLPLHLGLTLALHLGLAFALHLGLTLLLHLGLTLALHLVLTLALHLSLALLLHAEQVAWAGRAILRVGRRVEEGDRRERQNRAKSRERPQFNQIHYLFPTTFASDY
jgi:hypothetical protein